MPIENSEIENRLQTALLSIDQASIFTIHSFCQKVLREHALESGQLFNAELTNDLVQITQSCADDFWRKQLYQRSAEDAAILTADYKTPDELLQSVKNIGHHVKIYPTQMETVDDLLAKLKPLIKIALIELNRCTAQLQQAFSEGKFKKDIDKHFVAVLVWLNGESTQIQIKLLDF